jgi:pimeloyl-ACP methyl ester carboxylesterase
MPRRTLQIVVALTLSLLARPSRAVANHSVPGAAPSAAKLAMSECEVPGVPGKSRCGTYAVPEDRANPNGKTISLRVVVLPATGAGPALAPIVPFAGGPGQSVVDGAPGLATHAKLRERHDIVLVDVRGTGGSDPLVCDELAGARGVQGFLDNFLPVAFVKSCRAQHAARDLSQYRDAVSVDDVADLLTALGYQKAHLRGGSGGTRAALEMTRRHPDRVLTLGLAGLVPPDARLPLTFARDAQDALDATLRKCAADSDCAKAFPRVREELSAVLARTARDPAVVKLSDPKTGAASELRLNARGVAQTIRYMLYQPESAALIPLYVHAAAGGDFQPLAESAATTARFATGIINGYFLSVTCAEDVSFIAEKDVAPAIRGSFLDDFRIRAQQAACAEWPVPRAPADEVEPVHSDAPALLFSGERDPVTPARWGEEVARTLPNAVHLVVPDGGHSYNGLKGAECVEQLLDELVERGTTSGLDTSCVKKISGLPFATTLPVKEVALTPAQRERLVGTYAGEELVLTIEAVGDHLRAAVAGDGEKFLLVARSSTSFGLQGMPSSAGIEVEESEGRVVGIRVLGMADQPIVLTKR